MRVLVAIQTLTLAAVLVVASLLVTATERPAPVTGPAGQRCLQHQGKLYCPIRYTTITEAERLRLEYQRRRQP